MFINKRIYQFWLVGGISLCCLATTSLTQAQNVTTSDNRVTITNNNQAEGNRCDSLLKSSVSNKGPAHFDNALGVQRINWVMGDSNSSEAANQELQTAVRQLAQLGLTDEDEAFLLAELYIDYGQNAKAIDQLEALVNADHQIAAVPGKDADHQIATILEKQDEVRRLLKEAKSERAVSREKLKGLLGEVQALRSYSSCGKCQVSGGRGKRVLSPTLGWVCVGC